MAKEIFVISEPTNGFIKHSSRVDKAWDEKNKDGSTVSEFIETVLKDNPTWEAVYFPNQELPDITKMKISQSGDLVGLTVDDMASINSKKPKTLLDRVVDLETKIADLEST